MKNQISFKNLKTIKKFNKKHWIIFQSLILLFGLHVIMKSYWNDILLFANLLLFSDIYVSIHWFKNSIVWMIGIKAKLSLSGKQIILEAFNSKVRGSCSSIPSALNIFNFTKLMGAPLFALNRWVPFRIIIPINNYLLVSNLAHCIFTIDHFLSGSTNGSIFCG